MTWTDPGRSSNVWAVIRRHRRTLTRVRTILWNLALPARVYLAYLLTLISSGITMMRLARPLCYTGLTSLTFSLTPRLSVALNLATHLNLNPSLKPSPNLGRSHCACPGVTLTGLGRNPCRVSIVVTTTGLGVNPCRAPTTITFLRPSTHLVTSVNLNPNLYLDLSLRLATNPRLSLNLHPNLDPDFSPRLAISPASLTLRMGGGLYRKGSGKFTLMGRVLLTAPAQLG